jgi:hypothetical protein
MPVSEHLLLNTAEPLIYILLLYQVVRDGAKKVVFANFPEICNAMRRTGEHVFNFMLAELGTTGSIDGSQRMVIKGRFQPKAVEHVIRKWGYVMLWCPFYTPISAVSSWWWWLHAKSASGRRAPATEYIWMPKSTLVRRCKWVYYC